MAGSVGSVVRGVTVAFFFAGWGCAKSGTGVATSVRPIQASTRTAKGPLAHGVPGDFLLENDHLIAIISAADHPGSFSVSGGNLVDLASKPTRIDHLGEVMLYLGDKFPRQARYRKVELVKAFRGKTIRASGVDTEDPRVQIQTDYILGDDEAFLTIKTKFTNTSTTESIASYAAGDAIQWGQAQSFAPNHGLKIQGKRIKAPWLLADGERTSYGYVVPGKDVRQSQRCPLERPDRRPVFSSAEEKPHLHPLSHRFSRRHRQDGAGPVPPP